MAKSAKKASTKKTSPARKTSKTKTKAPKGRVRTGVADDIRFFLKQAGKPVTLAQLNAGVGKAHSPSSVYAALQYMGRRKEISRKGRGAKALFAVKAAVPAKPAAVTKAAPKAKRKFGSKAKSAGKVAATPAALGFGSMIAELNRVAATAEKALMHRAMQSTDQAIRAMAEMAADMRARAAKLSIR